MNYLSPQIEAMAKKKIKKEAPLVKKGFSCGIFQDYGNSSLNSSLTKDELMEK